MLMRVLFFGLALVVASAASKDQPFDSTKSKPNILFVVVDDLNTRIGPYADPELSIYTPHLDRLASEGMTFTKAYCQYPVCGASRASFMTGLYPETVKIMGNRGDKSHHKIANPALADHPTIGEFFRERGYYSARVSKIFHMRIPFGLERGEWGADVPESWDFASSPMAPETLSPGKLEKLSAGDHYGSNFARLIVPDHLDHTQIDVLAANQAVAIIESRAVAPPKNIRNDVKLKPDDPFFLAVGFVRPHVPLIAPERFFKRYPEKRAHIPNTPKDDLEDLPLEATRNANSRSGRFKMTTLQQRQSIAAYHASVSFMDEQLGRLLDALDYTGQRDNTIIVFFSDHGFNLGEHTSWQKDSLWDDSVRVPLIISVPEMKHAGARCQAVVELNDLFPTLADLAGLTDEKPGRLQGQSLVPYLENPDKASGHEYAYTVTHSKGASLRTARWRYSRWGDVVTDDNEELYDHQSDPDEFHNLARNPEYQSRLEELRGRLKRIQAENLKAAEG